MADGQEPPPTLNELVVERVEKLLRESKPRVSARELTRRLGVSHTWWYYRSIGKQAIDLNDLQRIADALDIPISDLLIELPNEDPSPPVAAKIPRQRGRRSTTGPPRKKRAPLAPVVFQPPTHLAS